MQLYIFLTAFFYMFSQAVFLFIVSGNCSMVPWELLSNSELKVVLWPIQIHKIIQCKCHSMVWLMIFMIFPKSYQEGDANVLHNHFLPCFFNLITYNHLQGQKKLHNPKQLRFIVLTAVTRMMALCRNVTPCSSINSYTVSLELLSSYSSSLNLEAVIFLWKVTTYLPNITSHSWRQHCLLSTCLLLPKSWC